MHVREERYPFKDMPTDERHELMARIADFVDRQSKILGEPTPELALRYLPKPPADRSSTA